MPITKAQELLANPDTSLGALLDCLAELSDNKGYLQAVINFKFRNRSDAISAMTEINSYMVLVKAKIESKINGQI